MVLTALGFAAVVGQVRYLSASYHPLEIVFFRNFFGLLAMAPWLVRVGWVGLRPRRPALFLWRALLSYTAMGTWFMAVSLIPLAQAVTLNFTAPFFSTILAVLLLGETVRIRRWAAIVIGFGGVLLIVRPEPATFTPHMLWPLVSAAAIAGATIAIKTLSKTESPEAIVVQLGVFTSPIALVPALFVWTTPDLEGWLWLFATGATGTLAQICLNRALAAADASAVAPFDYVRLPLVALIGYVFFGEAIDPMTWIGALAIVGSSAYVTHREQLAQRSVRAGSAAVAGEGGALRRAVPEENDDTEKGRS